MIKDMLERTSVRDYKKASFTNKDLIIIKKVINSVPTSTNAHQFSAIIIIEDKIKKAISKINFHQKHIAKAACLIIFIGDRFRIKQIIDKKKIDVIDKDYLFYEYTRMVTDASIASAMSQDALNELGYGVTYIGGLATNGDEANKLLNIPENAFVTVGLAVGKPFKKEKPKPKMEKIFMNKYNKIEAKKQLINYDRDNDKYFKSFAKMSYIDMIGRQISSDNYYFKHFLKSGKYLKKALKNLK